MMSGDKAELEAELFATQSRELAQRLGLTHQISCNDRGTTVTNYCLPTERGLTVTLSSCGTKLKGDLHHTVFGLTVAHHSNSTVLRSYAWPCNRKGLRATIACRGALLALPIDWTLAADALEIDDTRRELVLATFNAHLDQFGLDKLVLWNGRPVVEPPTTTVRIYVATEHYWEIFTYELAEGGDLLALLAEGVQSHRTNKGITAKFEPAKRVAHLGRLASPADWAEHGVSLTATPTRHVINASTVALDYGLVDTARGPEHVLLVLPSATDDAWPELVESLLAMLPEVEAAMKDAHRAPDWKRTYGTWSSGARAGQVRWPGKMPKAERAEHAAEQAAGDATRARAERLTKRLLVVVENIEDRTDHPRAPELLERLTAVKDRVHAMLPYRSDADFRRYVEGMVAREEKRRFARESGPASVARFGLDLGSRCRVLPAPWDEPKVERTGVVDRIKVVPTTTPMGSMPIVEHWRRVRLDGPSPLHVDAVVAIDDDWGGGEDLLRSYRRVTPL